MTKKNTRMNGSSRSTITRSLVWTHSLCHRYRNNKLQLIWVKPGKKLDLVRQTRLLLREGVDEDGCVVCAVCVHSQEKLGLMTEWIRIPEWSTTPS
jgi:NAD-dependent dihydropyrimidine dehydrogenase PreA subunit